MKFSAVQKGIWITQSQYPDSPLYNVGGYAHIQGGADINKLVVVINRVLENITAIKEYASFEDLRGELFIVDEKSYHISIVDHSKRTDAKTFCIDWMGADMRKPINLSEGILSVHILKSSPDTFYWYVKTHHLVFDGYCMMLFFKLVNDLYSNGGDLTNAQLNNYDLFVQAEYDYRTSKAYISDKGFWIKKLKQTEISRGFESCITSAIPAGSLAARRKEITIPRSLFDAIEECCELHGCTQTHYIIAIIYLLNRLYNNEPCIIGMVNHNRSDRAFKNTFGTCVNVMPLSFEAGDNDNTFLDVLLQVKREIKHSYRHHRMPVLDMAESIGSDTRIYNVLFSHQKFIYDSCLGDASATIRFLFNGQQLEDIVFHLLEYSTASDVVLAIDYKEALFEKSFIDRMGEDMNCLLEQMHRRVGQKLVDITCLKKDDYLLINREKTADSYFDYNNTITALFEKHTKVSPDKIAISCKEEYITYGELNSRANRLAAYLRATYTIKPDDLIAIELPRSNWAIIAMMGVLKSGAGYLPLDPDNPVERTNYIIKDSGSKAVINEDLLMAFRQVENRFSDENPTLVSMPNNLAYVIYTSGSTGQPKGCMLEHRGVVNRLAWMWHELNFATDDIILQKTNFTFDVSVGEIFMPLCFGAAIVICEKEDSGSPERLLSLIEKQKITCIHFVPGVLNAFIGELAASENVGPKLQSLRRVLASGEALLPELVNNWYKITSIPLYNLYGPTEASIEVTCYLTSPSLNRVPIGKPIWNTQLYIIGKYGQLLPPGITGEIGIGGIALARGYLNNPSLTQHKFVPNALNPGTRIYKTGDLGRLLPDGNFEFVGRNDSQVKIRGYRIELEEIEKIICRYKGIQAAVVIAAQVTVAEKFLVAYIVADEQVEITALRSFLSDFLPTYMVPFHFLQLPRLPLTSSGKIDRKKLPAPTELLMRNVEYIAPRNSTEVKLAEIWLRILEIDNVGVKDDFVRLGGDSLKISRLAGAINKAFEITVPLKALFDNTLLEEQALLITQSNPSNYSPIETIGLQQHYPLSPAQQRLWLINKIGIEKQSYNINGVYNFKESIDFNAFKRAVIKLIERHETLRTIFDEINGVPFQQLIDSAALDYDQVVVDASTINNYNERFPEIIQQFFDRDFSLNAWPLFRLLITSEEGKCRLYYSMHHIISDGWSMQLFLRDVLAIYKSELTAEPDGLPVLPIQYKDYAKWQNDQFSGKNDNLSEAYWVNQLKGPLPEMKLPFDFEGYSNSLHSEAKSVELHIQGDLREDIYRLLANKKISLFTLLVACFKIVISRLTGETDIIIGTPVANRTHDDIKNLVGYFLNTVMLRDVIDREQPVNNLLKQVNGTIVDGLENQAYPFERLLDKLKIKREPNRFPISSVFVNMLSYYAGYDIHAFESSTDNSYIQEFAKFDLECYFREYKNAVAINCVYKSSLFKTQTITYWMNEFLAVIKQVVANQDITIKNIRLFEQVPFSIEKVMPENEYEPFDAGSVNQSIVYRFEQTVLKYPDHPAIIHDDFAMTYSELNSWANGLAQRILSTGVKKGSNIALLLEHGRIGIIGIFGVLKSGNTYVPLDTDAPVSRLRYILKDTNCQLLIVSNHTYALAKTLCEDLRNLLVINLYSQVLPENANPGVTIDPQNNAYILYTSGSTGMPKGVVQTHRNVLHFNRVYTNNLHLCASDRISLLPAYTFDSAVMDIYGALLNGASIYPYNIKKSGTDLLAEWLQVNKISVFHTVPTVYRYFLAGLSKEVFHHIRLVVLGGEAVFKSDVQQFRAHFVEGAIFINGYGPTESTITLQKFLNHTSSIDLLNVPVGMAVQDTQVYLIQEDGSKAGIYQKGEIVYKSNYLSPGYWNQPSLTAAVFTTDPFTNDGRVYRSGDFGRLLPTGEIEFTGRKDNQVKLNGFRIELSDIEQNILKIKDVQEAVVLLKTIENKSWLVAYIRCDKQITQQVIKQQLQASLPAHMLPEVYMFIDKFPLTATGKISRLDLPIPTIQGLKQTEYIPPRNNTEKKLLGIWQLILNLERIGVKDHFFELGGNSLAALRLLAITNREFRINLKIDEVFSLDTIEALAEEVTRKIWLTGSAETDIDDRITITI